MATSTTANQLLLIASGGEPECLSELRADPNMRWLFADRPANGLPAVRSHPGLDAAILVVTESTLAACIEFCRAIKLDSRWSHVMVICVLTGPCDGRAVDLFVAGADDCMRSFVAPAEVTIRVGRTLRTKRAMESLEDSQRIIQALAQAVEGKDPYTCGHIDRVAAYSVEMGRRMGLNAEELKVLKLGGAVHDIGKIGVPDQILNKNGKLTDEEFEIMMRHPAIGYEILKTLRTFQNVLPMVRWHHEKPNGNGYPDHLAGEQIPLCSRIVAVADMFDALATDRPYRKALPLPTCVKIMLEAGAKGDLDAELVQILVGILGLDPASLQSTAA